MEMSVRQEVLWEPLETVRNKALVQERTSLNMDTLYAWQVPAVERSRYLAGLTQMVL